MEEPGSPIGATGETGSIGATGSTGVTGVIGSTGGTDSMDLKTNPQYWRNILSKTIPPYSLVDLPVVPQIQVTLNCNMNCSYCFQEHSGKIIDLLTVKKILEKTVYFNRRKEHTSVIQIYWHGGEPLLAGLDFFQRVVELESRFAGVSFENRLQTNGTLMDEEFARFFAENNFAVGFSLDGPEGIHNRYRNFKNGKSGSFEAVMEGIECYRRYNNMQYLPVIAVVTRSTLQSVRDFYDFFKSIEANVQLDIYDIRWKDFLPSKKRSPALYEMLPTGEEIGRFLIELFDLWFYDDSRKVDFHELRKEVKIILQPFIQLGNPIDKKRCDFRRLIIAPDGKAFSCDQYVNDESSALGDIQKDSLEEIQSKKANLWEQIKSHIRISSKNMACSSCPWGRQCSGGCITCLKYSTLLLHARSMGLPDSKWFEAQVPELLQEIQGETYYCEGLRSFRKHVKNAVNRELACV